MEDIKSLGKRRGGCPYFSSRRKIDSAQVVFCPFNYIIDPHIRKATGIDLENCVVIFDEGHNIADVCRDAASIELTSKEMKKLQGNMVKAQRKLGLDNIPKVLTAIGDYLDMQKHKMGGYPKDRTEMFDAKDTQLQWTEMSLTYEMICEAAAEVGRLRELLDDPLDTMAANEQQPVLPRDLTIVGKLMDVAEFLLKPGNDVHFRSSVTWHFEEGEISFNIYCMTASLGMPLHSCLLG
jgi:Rad3-related DNA helicase